MRALRALVAGALLVAIASGCNQVQTKPQGTGGDGEPEITGAESSDPTRLVGNPASDASPAASPQDQTPQEPIQLSPSTFPGGGATPSNSGQSGSGLDPLDTDEGIDSPLAVDSTPTEPTEPIPGEFANRPFMTLKPVVTDEPEELLAHLQAIEAALSELVTLSSDNRINKALFIDSGRRLGRMKLQAGETLANSRLATEAQRSEGVKTQLIALSHLSSLNDASAARQLNALAEAAANSSDKDLAHQSRLVLVGFQLQALQNGVEAKPEQLVAEIRGLFENFDSRTFPEFMMLQQADMQLSRLGFKEQAQQIRNILAVQYQDAEDEALRNEAWLAATSESPELADYNYANQLLSSGQLQAAEILAPTQRLYEAFPSVQTLEQLSKSISNMEYLGFLDASQEVATFVRAKLDGQPQSAAFQIAQQLLSDHDKRLELLGSPFPWADLENSLRSFEGDNFQAETLQGKVVLVSFWTTWSVPCIEELEAIRVMQQKYAGDGLEVVSVVMDDIPSKSEAFIQSKRLPWTNYFFADEVGFESSFIKDHGVNIVPFVAIVGRQGEVQYLHSRGANLEPNLRAALGLPASLIENIQVP